MSDKEVIELYAKLNLRKFHIEVIRIYAQYHVERSLTDRLRRSIIHPMINFKGIIVEEIEND